MAVLKTTIRILGESQHREAMLAYARAFYGKWAPKEKYPGEVLRGGYFLPGDEKIGRDIADALGREIINAYYAAMPQLKKGGQIVANNIEKVFAVASEEVNDMFVRVLRATIGKRYHELNSKKRIDAINKLSGQEQMQAIRKHGEELANILKSLPSGKANDIKKEIGWWT